MTTLLIGHDQIDKSMKNRMIQINTHQTLITVLPEHLIVEHILPRLPVKPLFRFKIVCKFWNSIISSYEFALSHLKISSLRPQFVLLSQDLRLYDNYTLDFKLFLLPCDRNDSVGELVRLNLDQNWVFTIIDIVGCCNGLLCLYLEVESSYSSFIVWNPVTRQCRKIRIPVGEDLCLDYGFGYASSIDDYKIVAQFSQRNLGGGYLYVFSLRTGEWKSIDRSDDDVIIVINDTFHWFHKSMSDWQKPKCILGFDLVDDKLKEIPWINCFNQYKRGYFFGMKGYVSFYCEGDQGSDVWVLNQFADKNSWQKLFTVNLGEMSFLNFTETGKCLVESSGKLGVINSSQKSQLVACFSEQIAATGVYVESFISPFVNQS